MKVDECKHNVSCVQQTFDAARMKANSMTGKLPIKMHSNDMRVVAYVTVSAESNMHFSVALLENHNSTY